MRQRYLIVTIGGLLCSGSVTAQQQASVAASLGLIVYPSEGQSAATQNEDEAACYQWARQATGLDPMKPAEATAPAATPAGDQGSGAAAQGAARGAAGAALIAEIADADTGEAAAVGAVIGARRGAREKEVRTHAAQQQAQSQAEAGAQQQRETFNKGFAACLEGKHYTVK